MSKSNSDYKQTAKDLAEYSQVFFGIIRLPGDDAMVLMKGEPKELVNTIVSHLEQDELLFGFLSSCVELVKAHRRNEAQTTVAER